MEGRGKGGKTYIYLSYLKTSRGLEAAMNEDENRWKEQKKIILSAGVKEDNSKFLCGPVPDWRTSEAAPSDRGHWIVLCIFFSRDPHMTEKKRSTPWLRMCVRSPFLLIKTSAQWPEKKIMWNISSLPFVQSVSFPVQGNFQFFRSLTEPGAEKRQTCWLWKGNTRPVWFFFSQQGSCCSLCSWVALPDLCFCLVYPCHRSTLVSAPATHTLFCTGHQRSF